MTSKTLEKALYNPDFLIKLATELKTEKEKRQALEIQAEENKPKVLFADVVSTSQTSILSVSRMDMLFLEFIQTLQVELILKSEMIFSK